jgi:hypothetical protein
MLFVFACHKCDCNWAAFEYSGPEPIVEARAPALSSGALIGIIIAALFVLTVIVDISCFVFNKAGTYNKIILQINAILNNLKQKFITNIF